MRSLDPSQLAEVHGGAKDDDPMGPTALVAGRPQTCAAIMARGEKLFARGNDPTISNEKWLREYKKLNDGFQRLPNLSHCPPSKE